MSGNRHRVSPDDLVKVEGNFTAIEMAAAIVKSGAVRRMYHADIERMLVNVVNRTRPDLRFTFAGVPPAWPTRGNIFLLDDTGKRWRMFRDENIYGGFYIKVQEQKAKVRT